MLRITVEEKNDRIIFRLEGKLIGTWVQELERCWISTRNYDSVNRLFVDLSSVSFVDDKGKALLTRMVSHGAKLVAKGLLMTSLAKEITARTTSPVEENSTVAR
ncbi:MAG: STAS domain-containing protein [Candidatus Sulfotelmatobacter sp.]